MTNISVYTGDTCWRPDIYLDSSCTICPQFKVCECHLKNDGGEKPKRKYIKKDKIPKSFYKGFDETRAGKTIDMEKAFVEVPPKKRGRGRP